MLKEEILDLEELKKYLKCSKSTIRNLIYKHKIPYFRIGAKYYFRKESIDKWIKENERY